MAINSWGYFNDVTPGDQWSLTAAYATARFWVYNQDAVRVTPLIGGTREVQISTGEFGCYGIYNENTTVATVQLPAPVSEGTQWYLISATHTWADALSATTFEALHCGSVAQIPAGRVVNPGTKVTQPLAYVPITFGESDPGTPIDLRAMGIGREDVLINSEFALPYLAYAGMRCRLGKIEYSRTLNSSGTTHEWFINRGSFGRNPITDTSSWGSSYSGWTTVGVTTRAVRDGNSVELDFRIRRTGANINVASDGGVVDANAIMFNANSEWRPTRPAYAIASYISPGGGNYMGLASIDTNGDISFTAGTPGVVLSQRPAGSWSLSCTFNFIQTGV